LTKYDARWKRSVVRHYFDGKAGWSIAREKLGPAVQQAWRRCIQEEVQLLPRRVQIVCSNCAERC
jgi:transposase-like protein